MSYHRKTMKKREDGVVWLNDKDALWQYFLDHARPHEDGGYGAYLYTASKDSFFKSLKARQMGLYKYTQEEVDAKKDIVRHESKFKQFLRKLLIYIP